MADVPMYLVFLKLLIKILLPKYLTFSLITFQILTIEADLAKEGDCNDLIDRTLEVFGDIDVLVGHLNSLFKILERIRSPYGMLKFNVTAKAWKGL